MKRENDDENEQGSSSLTQTAAPPTKKRRESKNESHVQLSSAIKVFFDQKLSDHADIFGGMQLHGHFASLPIAVKLVDQNERNKREAKILSKLRHHNNVISLIETGVYDNGIECFIYIVVDKCHEQNLREYIENCNEILLEQKHAILRQIIAGVEYIHEKNIAHLDLKPGNILFTLDQKTIKIADFGLSEEIPQKKLLVKYQFGSSGFRPPESFGNSYVSLKTDIFSLGAVFHFVLSNGKNPFGEDPDGQNVNSKNGKIDLSCLLVPNCETTKHLIKSMLELKRSKRPTISQVSEHPCWSWSEVECDFDYETCDSSDSDSCNEEDEPSYHPGDLSTLTALLERYRKEDESSAAAGTEQEHAATSRFIQPQEVGLNQGHPGEFSRELAEKADELMKDSRFNEAISLLHDAPTTWRQQMILAECYFQIRSDENAKKCIENMKTLVVRQPRPKADDIYNLGRSNSTNVGLMS